MAQLPDSADAVGGVVLDEYGLPRSGKSRNNEARDAKAQRTLYHMFVVLALGITLFQKIGYAPNTSFVVPVILPLFIAVLGYGILFGAPLLRPGRLLLYLAVLIGFSLSSVALAPKYSPESILLFAALYLPFVVAFRTTRETFLACMNFFSSMMLVFAAVVWLQHAMQFTIGWRYWPDLDKLVPSEFLIPQFNYIQPIRYGLDLMKPSGIVFLEVSTLSQFLTLALVIELLFFERLRRAMFLGATLFATFAGTGLLLMLAALPIVFIRMRTRTFIMVLGTVIVAVVVAWQLSWFELVMNRVDEFQKVGSSANSRFIEPLYRMARALGAESGVYSGIGAGQIESGGNTFWWPITKAAVEYGLIQALLFYGFFLYCLLDRTPSRRFAFVIVLWYSFEGNLLTAYNPLACVMLMTMFVTVAARRPAPAPLARTRAAGPAEAPA